MILEAGKHTENCFLTLTYSDDRLPKGATLDPDHTKRFFYRYRENLKNASENKIRYYLVGEYGEKTQRPHYHAAIFGIGCRGPRPDYYPNKDCKCSICEITRTSWQNGFIGIGTLTNDSASYIAGYLQKTVMVDGQPIMGLTDGNNPLVQKWLKGRHPEFTRMSRKPGIGGDAVGHIVNSITTTHGCDFVSKLGDVPFMLAHGGKKLPLGRYLREKIRKEYGFKKKTTIRGSVSYAPEDSLQKLSERNNEKREKIHQKAKKIKKCPYTYEKDLRAQRIKQQEIIITAKTNSKGAI